MPPPSTWYSRTGPTETLRLTGVDKPWAGETGEDGPGIACLYDWTTHAAEFVGWMLLSRTVTVVLDGNRTAAGTLLGRIYVNGDDFAAGLVQIGLARVDADAKADQEGYYRRLENEARARKLGLSPNSGQDTARPPFRGDRGSFWPVHDGIEVRVVRAIDGSTIEVAFQDGTTTTVGFLGVQVPAAGAEGSCLARWRELGAEYVRALLSRQTVTIIVEPHRRGVDPYPGLLAYVHLRGRDLGAALVEQGYASVSSRPRSGREDESLEISGSGPSEGPGPLAVPQLMEGMPKARLASRIEGVWSCGWLLAVGLLPDPNLVVPQDLARASHRVLPALRVRAGHQGRDRRSPRL